MKNKCFVKEASVLLIITIILSSVGAMAAYTQQQTATGTAVTSGTTWYVHPGESIQAAIDAASPGDTVYVYNGTYYGDISIDKSIKLIGEDKHNTIIDGEGAFDVVEIDDTILVTISGFTIRNGLYKGIAIDPNTNCNKITGNIITNCGGGIYIWDSNYNTVYNNVVIYNDDVGIMITDGHSNIIWGNIITNSDEGIELCFAGLNVIGGTDWKQNTISNNHIGIYVDFCLYMESTLRENNNFSGNDIDIYGAIPDNADQSIPSSQPITTQQSTPAATIPTSTPATTTSKSSLPTSR